MIRVFGYGSLVNRKTQSFGGRPHTLNGWRRVWVATPARKAAFLSVERAETKIDGLVFEVPDADLPQLDQREAQYERVADQDLTVYAVPLGNRVDRPAPILRSYLDTVLQGFLVEFGEDGPTRFMQTTTSWDRGIIDDRADPIYPRMPPISDEERERFDALLNSVPVVRQL